MKLPKISIVIPSYNKVKYIKDTLDSIFIQRYENLEVIIQDGGSNDGTLEIIKKFLSKYPKNIKLESKKDNGQLEAINKGFKKASGDIITYINADDVYEESAFKIVAEYFLENPNAFWFVGKGRVIDSRGNEIAKLPTWYKNLMLKHANYKLLLINNFIMQPSVFLTKKTYREYRPFTGTPNFVMEYDMWLKILRVKKPVVINRLLSSFRIEKSTITKNKTHEILEEDEKIVKRYTNNVILIYLHKLNNALRILVNKSL